MKIYVYYMSMLKCHPNNNYFFYSLFTKIVGVKLRFPPSYLGMYGLAHSKRTSYLMYER